MPIFVLFYKLKSVYSGELVKSVIYTPTKKENCLSEEDMFEGEPPSCQWNLSVLY